MAVPVSMTGVWLDRKQFEAAEAAWLSNGTKTTIKTAQGSSGASEPVTGNTTSGVDTSGNTGGGIASHNKGNNKNKKNKNKNRGGNIEANNNERGTPTPELPKSPIPAVAVTQAPVQNIKKEPSPPKVEVQKPSVPNLLDLSAPTGTSRSPLGSREVSPNPGSASNTLKSRKNKKRKGKHGNDEVVTPTRDLLDSSPSPPISSSAEGLKQAAEQKPVQSAPKSAENIKAAGEKPAEANAKQSNKKNNKAKSPPKDNVKSSVPEATRVPEPVVAAQPVPVTVVDQQQPPKGKKEKTPPKKAKTPEPKNIEVKVTEEKPKTQESKVANQETQAKSQEPKSELKVTNVPKKDKSPGRKQDKSPAPKSASPPKASKEEAKVTKSASPPKATNAAPTNTEVKPAAVPEPVVKSELKPTPPKKDKSPGRKQDKSPAPKAKADEVKNQEVKVSKEKTPEPKVIKMIEKAKSPVPKEKSPEVKEELKPNSAARKDKSPAPKAKKEKTPPKQSAPAPAVTDSLCLALDLDSFGFDEPEDIPAPVLQPVKAELKPTPPKKDKSPGRKQDKSPAPKAKEEKSPPKNAAPAAICTCPVVATPAATVPNVATSAPVLEPKASPISPAAAVPTATSAAPRVSSPAAATHKNKSNKSQSKVTSETNINTSKKHSSPAPGGKSGSGKVTASNIANEISRARDQIRQTLDEAGGKSSSSRGSSIGGGEQSNKKIQALETENKALKQTVDQLVARLSKLETRVSSLEKSPATSQTAVNGSKAPKVAAKDEDDSDVDLFGSDDEEGDAAAAEANRKRVEAYNAKKAKKPALVAKSSVVLDVKPWDDETDLKVMEEQVRSIQMDGLVWGASKLVPVAFNIKKLQIVCVVEDDKISIEELQEKIEENEDYVQSVDIAAFNKI